MVFVKKHNRKWRVSINIFDPNRVFPNDSFLFPRIDQLVDSISGHELLTFMDAYSGYNQNLLQAWTPLRRGSNPNVWVILFEPQGVHHMPYLKRLNVK